MKIKKVLCLLLTITVLGQTSLTLASEEIPELSDEQPSDLFVSVEEISSDQQSQTESSVLDLSIFVSTDDKGTVTIPESGLLDFLFPEEIDGESVCRIGPGAFQGCSYFRTIVIPVSITEIGEDAFADCPNLEKIILLGRADDQDLILGENWSGDAEVIYELEQAEEELPADAVEETNEPMEATTTEETLSDESQSTPPAKEEETPLETPEEITTELPEDENLETPELPPTEQEGEETPAPIDETPELKETKENISSINIPEGDPQV